MRQNLYNVTTLPVAIAQWGCMLGSSRARRLGPVVHALALLLCCLPFGAVYMSGLYVRKVRRLALPTLHPCGA